MTSRVLMEVLFAMDWRDQFDKTAKQIRDEEDSFYTFSGKKASTVREQEEEGAAPKVPNARNLSHEKREQNRTFNQEVLQRLFKSKKLRRNSSLITLLLVLFGGGGALTVFFSPTLAIIQMKEVFTQNLNEQLHAVDERSAVLLRSKLKDLTSGSCGAIKIQCKFKTLSDKQVEKFKAAGIEIETTPADQRKWYNNRGQIEKISFKDDKGNKIDITKPENLQKELLSNVPFRAAMIKGYNPLFASLTDKTALSVIRKLKISRAPVVTGESDEERQKRINDVVSGVEDSNAKTVSIRKDEDGNDHYYDSGGNELTKEEYDAGKAQAERGENYLKNGGTKGVLDAALKGASIVGYMDSACTVFNSLRFMSATAKTIMMAQAARFSYSMVLNPADWIKAEGANEDSVNFIGNNLATPYEGSETLDESQLRKPGSAEHPATVADPEKGKVAQDGPGYRMAAYGDAPDLSMRASKFMIGGGPTSLFDGFLQGVATVVNLGDPNPQKVSEKCGYIQNPIVRFGGLAIGIVAGVGTFGLSTALGIGGSLAFAMMLPYIEAHGAEILAGNVFQNISGIDSGDAAAVGAVAFFGSIAKARGMKPTSAAEGMKYAAASQASRSRYIETQQYLARATPFDITNPYSFVGSIAGTLAPTLQRSKASASAAMMNITSLIPTSFASLVKPAKAARTLDENYYKKCNDIGYQELGIGADAFCGVHYGLSDEELAMDPIENVDWMVANNEIDPDTGEAKPEGGPVDDSNWSYAKFMKECPNRTVGWGENQDENEGNGFNCVDPAKEEKNKHYRVYTLDKSVDESLDGEPVGTVGSSAAITPREENGVVGADGWAFPTRPEFTITSDYESPDRPDHKGVDIAGKSAVETEGEPIFAAYDGVVKAAGQANGYGNWIVIEHNIGGKIMSTVYGHMYDDGVLVRVNQTVHAGDQIGRIGSAGNSTGPHLHFEVWEGSPLDSSSGKQVNPNPYLTAARKPKQGAINV